MFTASPAAMIRDLRSRTHGLASALVARDGRVLYADLPPDVYAETFAIMWATVLGAAATASRELRRAPPERIVVGAEDSRTLILASGRDAFVVLVVGPSSDVDTVLPILRAFADLLRSDRTDERRPERATTGVPGSAARATRSRNG